MMTQPNIDFLDEPLPGVASTYPTPRGDQNSPDSQSGRNLSKFAQISNLSLSTLRTESKDETKGYGTDPNLVTPVSVWPKTLTLYERSFISALSDVILPATKVAPAPSQILISDFFDDWLSAPYEDQLADKQQVLSGLASLDGISRDMFANAFLQLGPDQRKLVLDELIGKSEDGKLFFIRFRYLVIGGYFTSDVGMRALGYRGNIPLKKPQSVPPDVLAIIEQELQKLGL